MDSPQDATPSWPPQPAKLDKLSSLIWSASPDLTLRRMEPDDHLRFDQAQFHPSSAKGQGMRVHAVTHHAVALGEQRDVAPETGFRR